MTIRISPPPVVVTLAIAAVAYWLFWPTVRPDLIEFNIPWLEHIIAAGPFAAFAQPFANYNPPYLYLLALVSPLHNLLSPVTLIKLISLGGNAAIAVATYSLLKERGIPQAARWAALTIILPTTVLNAATLGQCDGLYVAPAIAALSAALSRRHVAMLIWCGVSIAFKLQAILFAPFIVALLINRRVPLYQWIIPVVVFLISLLPAWALGWPLDELLGIYSKQTRTFLILSMSAPNVWFIVQNIVGNVDYLSGPAMVLGMCAAALYVAWFSIRMPEGNWLFIPAILSVLITAGLLPHMHERYFLFADIAAFVFAISAGTGRSWWIALLVQTGSASAMIGYLTVFPWLTFFGAELMVFATIFVIWYSVTRSGREDTDIAHGASQLPSG
jgi:Gpi18-like mannosyltransferase